MKSLQISLLFAVLLAGTNAFAYECRWSAEGTNSHFSSQPFNEKLHSIAPRVYTNSSCGTKLCMGQLYCQNMRGSAPIVIYSTCKAVNGKCPSANDCADDKDVVQTLGLPTQSELASGNTQGLQKSQGNQ